jgi:hypothetical protein
MVNLGIYKVYVIEGHYQIFWCPSAPLHYNDRMPYSDYLYAYPSAAYRRCKQLNEQHKKDVKV